MKKILINKENHARFNAVTSRYDWLWNQSLHFNNSLSDYLDEKLHGNEDYSGQYATWLEDIGIDSQTDNGWWSLAAIDEENIQAFISYKNDESDGGIMDRYNLSRKKLKEMSEIGRFVSKIEKAVDIIDKLYTVFDSK